MKQLLFKRLYDDVVMPKYQSAGAAGFDLAVHNFIQYHNTKSERSYEFSSSYKFDNSSVLASQDRILIGCGFALGIPEGFQVEVRTRSGMALKQGLIILNSPGTIDSDYTGEIMLILHNTTRHSIRINKGDRLGQGVLMMSIQAEFVEAEELRKTQRGAGMAGSTGGYSGI